MKKSAITRLALLLLVAVISSCMLSSCFMLGGAREEYMTEDEVDRLIQNAMLGDVTIDKVNEYDITIENGSGNLLAAAKGVLSAVSISSEFVLKKDAIISDATTRAVGAGAGVIYKLDKPAGDAYIVTNFHVVYNSASVTSNGIGNNIKVYLYGMESDAYAIPATFVGGSLTQDLAVLKVNGSRILAESNAVAATIADSDGVSILDTAIAIGNPAADGISATVGCVNVDSEYVSMVAADEKTSVKFRLMRIDTAVNEGNSGGGLFNDRGELIGIVNSKIISNRIDNIAYAIPSNVVSGVVDNIIHYCDGTSSEKPLKYSMGITMKTASMYTEYDTETGKVHKRETVAVETITEGSVAAELFRVNDIIKAITIDGQTYEIYRMFRVIDCMFRVYESSTVTVTVQRGAEEMTVNVPVSRMSAQAVE